VTVDTRVASAALCALLALAVAPASGQTRGAGMRRLEVGGGAGVAGAASLGDRDANLLTNNSNGTPFRLFSTESRLEAAPFVEARLGYRLTSRLTAEGRLTVARPTLRVSLSADVENAASVDAEARLTEYVLEGGLQWRLAAGQRRRLIPFATGGAGLARHVHPQRALVEDGVSGYAGGGVLYVFGAGAPGAGTTTGLRVDARVQLLGGGLASAASPTARGAASASVFVAF
jgi:hypothetical protein